MARALQNPFTGALPQYRNPQKEADHGQRLAMMANEGPNSKIAMDESNDQRDVILSRLAEIRAVIKKSDDTLRTARDLEGHLTTVLREVGVRLRNSRGTIRPLE